MANGFFDQIHALNLALSSDLPIKDRWEVIRPLLQDESVEREFWKALDDPSWIGVLSEAGLFSSPPLVVREGDTFRFPNWPASRYLARMASRLPGVVASILKNIESDNPSVIGDILEAAKGMPAETAAVLVPAVVRAAKSSALWLHLKEANALCVKLGDAGHLYAALELSEALFMPRQEAARGARWQRDQYWYKEGLRTVVPILASRAAESFLPRLCDWLKELIEANERHSHDADNDYSYIWRPAIEEHDQNSDHEQAAVMVGFVRQAFETAIVANKLNLAQALELLDRHSLLVFKRLRVHLIGAFGEEGPELVRRTILDKEMLDDYRFKHEYAVLIGQRFNMLSSEEQAGWFKWVDDGPDMTNFDASFKAGMKHDPTAEDRRRRIEYWQFEKLHLIRAHLTGDRREYYERMLAIDGEPELADLNVMSGPVRWGSESPFTVEQLAAMPFAAAVDAVTSWKGERDSFRGPDVEGLASAFEQYVATNPVAFSTESPLLIGKPAIFVRGFIRKLSEAIKEGQLIHLGAALELCRWVIERPVAEHTSPEGKRSGLVDRDWQWTRDAISGLIENVCKASRADSPVYPPEQFRAALWKLLDVLCRDPARSYIVEDREQPDLRANDFLDMAINSPRGKAVEAALEYARWVANQQKVKEGERDVVPGGFDSMLEVRTMLEWQIAAQNRSFEALAVIGSRVPAIYWIDKEWLGEKADRLFDLPEIERNPQGAAGWAAWNAFLVWVGAHAEFYKLFKASFAYAVQQCASVQSSDRSRHHPMNHLGEHLMVLYGRGQLELDDDGSLLRTFLTTANSDVRRHAIGFVGQSLEGDTSVPEATLRRFMALWEFYWEGAGKNDAAERPDAWLFGPWFDAKAFPTDWALARLEEYVNVTGLVEPDHAVSEELAKLASTEPGRCVRILDRIVRRDQEGWRAYSWLDSSKEILKAAIDAGGDAREVAERLIDHLGRRGYVELGNLLPS